MFRNRLSDSDPCLILVDYNFLLSWALQLYFVDSEGCSRRVRKIEPPQHSGIDKLVSHCLLIYNPFVGDAVRVPPANRFPYQSEVFGFGFHPRTGEFKVVRIVWYENDTDDESMVQVFTVGTTEWRNKGAPPPQLTDEIGSPEALVEGSLHWVTVVRVGGVSPILDIISFELADEVLEEIPHPPCQQLVSYGYSLSVLNGCLTAAGLVDTLHFDIWVMKQYRVKESWVKQFSFDPRFPG
ncbi:hypothetical protein SLEP1_g25784 [Rubroshorea leprosula]|uniref:F-box associated beta-propeller type 1 domain-containing protein n=1 Tax=Rubroshorea leprosula TaxID=152421 RepID=A0AAV5JR88_9ROSI|nr:hypothetical protein SLEP1_g25784 [Rubroshorea leprosula]